MTINFTINKSREKLEKQWKYLLKIGANSVFYPFLKKFFRGLVLVTGIYLLFYFFVPASYFIIARAIGAGFIFVGWIVIILASIFVYFRSIKNKLWLNRFLNSINADQLNYDVQINDDCVKILFGENVTELPWTDFTWFGIHNDTIYVLNKVCASNSLYWDRDEMGNDNYAELIDLIKQKPIEQTF